jgi:micrococcal nuclease
MKYRIIWILFVFIGLIVASVLFGAPELKQISVTKPSPKNTQTSLLRTTAKVERAVDGDTIKVLIKNQEDTVRLIGIDAPETSDPKKPIQCFGEEARDKAKELLTGKTIILESDPTQSDRDEYGRLLRYVFLDGLNFNKLMISEGYAREYTFKGKIYKYQAEFIQAEKKAKAENRGLRSSC